MLKNLRLSSDPVRSYHPAVSSARAQGIKCYVMLSPIRDCTCTVWGALSNENSKKQAIQLQLPGGSRSRHVTHGRSDSLLAFLTDDDTQGGTAVQLYMSILP